jgi:type IV secretory pathway VirB2 component (pilin)
MVRVESMWNKILNLSVGVYVRGRYALESHSSGAMLILGLLILLHGQSHTAAAQDKWGQVCLSVLELMEGPFGSLCTACAGIGAICAAAMGGFKMAWTLVVVSVGSFILREYYKVFFPECS